MYRLSSSLLRVINVRCRSTALYFWKENLYPSAFAGYSILPTLSVSRYLLEVFWLFLSYCLTQQISFCSSDSLSVLGTNSLFMSSRLLGTTNFAKKAATQTWFVVQYSPEASPENVIELAHRMRPGGALNLPVTTL